MSHAHTNDKQMKKQIIEDAIHSLRKYDRSHWVTETKEAFRPLHLVFHWKHHLDSGITMEYTLVYHSEKETYTWIIEDVMNKDLWMKQAEPADDLIEAVVSGSRERMTSTSIQQYIERKLPTLPDASLSGLGFGFIPVSELQMMIWPHVAVNIRRFEPGFSSGVQLLEKMPVLV
ncbi:hypothetical protein [Halobacillus sp. BBL2006]|uniref:hypothetical protein n=1 Tax=Halobacillus sp. BBL2006 TaxID=1543706 RepID=UPI000543E028|nr:hypothetical protein [Halobacillus sp. BBL2006]KHE67199.1 hypothetical protein LD39_18770 [Halobacillus sp. BBL2006]